MYMLIPLIYNLGLPTLQLKDQAFQILLNMTNIGRYLGSRVV